MSTQPKVACRICKREEHILIEHIVKKHKMSPTDYLDKYKGAPLWSSYGLAKVRQFHHGNAKIVRTPRPRRVAQISELFPKFGLRKGLEVRGEYPIFDTPGPATPKLDKRYYFPEEVTLDTLAGLAKRERNRVWIRGFSGTGKTTFGFNLAAIINAEVMEWNADKQQHRDDIIGRWGVKDGETVFHYGIIPLAMMHGMLLLINEVDMLDPDTTNILKPVLEDPPRLTILENGGEVIEGHPDFRVIAMANTWGGGDSSGQFVNVSTQSEADRRRWSIRLNLDYMDPDDESDMLRNYFGDKLGDEEKESDPKDSPEKFIKVANKVREAFKAGTIDKTFSAGELVNWVENYLHFGKGIHHAARISFLNALEPDNQTAIGGYVDAVFGHEEKP